jgi:hypothetical protein
MEENEISLIKTLIAKTNALEKTILASPMSDEYQKNLAYWLSDLNSRIGGAYLQGLFDEPTNDPNPPEQ